MENRNTANPTVPAKAKLTPDDRTRIINWLRERGGDLYQRRYSKRQGKTPEAMAQAMDQACNEFIAGKGPTI